MHVYSHQLGTEDPSWASHWCNPTPNSDAKVRAFQFYQLLTIRKVS